MHMRPHQNVAKGKMAGLDSQACECVGILQQQPDVCPHVLPRLSSKSSLEQSVAASHGAHYQPKLAAQMSALRQPTPAHHLCNRLRDVQDLQQANPFQHVAAGWKSPDCHDTRAWLFPVGGGVGGGRQHAHTRSWVGVGGGGGGADARCCWAVTLERLPGAGCV